MIETIVVVGLLTVSAAIFACVAISRGWLNLKSHPTENKSDFILMRKKASLPKDEKLP